MVSPRGDGVGGAVGADGRLSRQGKNYEKNYKTTYPCKAYMVLRLVYPRIISTALNDFVCKTALVAAHRITSSAWKRRVSGIVRPSAWAVLRLMTSSNFVGCSTGRSAGLVPLRILSTYAAARRDRSDIFGP